MDSPSKKKPPRREVREENVFVQKLFWFEGFSVGPNVGVRED
jgi:hypothetical protein